MKYRHLIPWIVTIIIISFIYRKWLGLYPLSSGDWSYHFPEEVTHFFVLPWSWIFWFHGGLGGNGVFFTGLETYFLDTARLFYTVTGLGWAISERIIWYIPFLILGFFSSVFFIRTVFPKCDTWWVAPIIFLSNTYILMMTGGGQMGVAIAYALSPLVLAQFIRLMHIPTFRRSIVTGLVLSLMILFDARLVYTLMLAVGIYWIMEFVPGRKSLFPTLWYGLIPIVIAGLLHMFWILPLIVFRTNPVASLGTAYSSIESVRFFSFGDFSHAFSLLHPNWPENLFGKVYFLQPEFIIIPILAWSVFLSRRISLSIVSFGFTALLGIFLAKGANDPGGSIYLWLFTHVPGFNVFRDPTKFYLLTVIAYSILIPLSLDLVGNKLPRGLFRKALPGIIFTLFWLFTIRQAITGQLDGTFTFHTVPYDYKVLKDVINQPDYFRTFWVPHASRYGFSTYTHPAIDAGTLLDASPSAVLTWLNSSGSADQLARWSVRYVILPYDSQGEIFVDDRKYSESVRQQFQAGLDTNPYLKKISLSGLDNKISVYEPAGYKDHLWLEDDSDAQLTWRMISPASYAISISGLGRPVQLIFSESYDPDWQLIIDGRIIRSQKTKDALNSFSLPTSGNINGTVQYAPQRYVWTGLFISTLTIIGVVVAFIVL